MVEPGGIASSPDGRLLHCQFRLDLVSGRASKPTPDRNSEGIVKVMQEEALR
jgi:hypothetical protein